MFLIPIIFLIVSTISPGPVTILTVHNTAKYGRSAGFSAALGGATTTAIFVIIAMLIISGDNLINVSVDTTNTFRQASALFIIAMGVLTGYHTLIDNQPVGRKPSTTNSKRKSFFSGMMLMLPYLPQAILFYTIILPQYVVISANLFGVALMMGAFKIVLTLIWYSTLSCLAISVQKWFFRMRVQRFVGATVSCFFMGTGIKMFIG